MKLILASILMSLALALSLPRVEAASAEVGKPAPSFSLKDLDGTAVNLADYKDKIVVLHFQSANCPWDKAYQPLLNRIAAAYRSKGVVFIAINANADETAARIKAYTEKSPVDYAIVKDEGAVVADEYNARVTPHVFVIDAKQSLAYAGGIEKEPGSPREAGESKEQYLEPVLAALTGGKKVPVTSTKPTGSKIQRK